MKIETEQEYEQYKNLVGKYMEMLAKADSLKLSMEEELIKYAKAVEKYEKIHYPVDKPKYTEGQIRLALSKFGPIRNGNGWALSVNNDVWNHFIAILDDIVINDESY